MDYTAFGPYFMAVAALTAAPGPVMAVLAARSLGRDTKGAVAFATGLCAGDMIAVLAVALGVGVWAESQPDWLALAKYAGVAYLLWLSTKMWTDRASTNSVRQQKRGFAASAGAGIGICLGNPSTLLIYMLLLPGVAPRGIESFEHLAMLVLVTFAAVATVFFGTILLARQVNRIIASPGSSNILSRTMAATIAVTSVWILAA